MLLEWEVGIINFTFDLNGRYEYPEMELCNPDKTELYMIKHVSDLNMILRYSSCSELSFTAYKEVNGVQMEYFEKLQKNRIIHVEGFGYFVIVEYTQNYQNRIPSKSITAYSAEYILNNKGINLTFVTTPNDSTKVISKSYKFWDELDRYSQEKTSLLGCLLEIAPQWSVGNISHDLINQYRSFDSSDKGLYGFLMNDVAQSYNCMFVFDFENYLVNAYITNNLFSDAPIRGQVQRMKIGPCSNSVTTTITNRLTGLGIEYEKYYTTDSKTQQIIETGTTSDANALTIYNLCQTNSVDVVFEADGNKDTNIVMTFDNVLQNATIDELSDDIYTVLNVKGADNLSIARISPIGTAQLFKLDYYVGSLTPTDDNYYMNYNDWITDNDLKHKVLTWQQKLYDMMINFQDDPDSYGMLLQRQNALYYDKLTQEAAYTDEKTLFETAQMQLKNYMDDQTTKTESGKTTRYKYWQKYQQAYEHNMKAYKSGGTLYNTDDESIFDSSGSLGTPTGTVIHTVISESDPDTYIYSIDCINDAIDDIISQRDEIVNTYSYENYFTSSERTILEPYLREGEYQDSSFTITDSMNIADYSDGETWVETTDGVKQIKDLKPTDTIIDANYVAMQLLEAGYKKLDEVSVPSFTFSMTTMNFLFIEKFTNMISQLEFGAIISVQLSDGTWVYPYFQEMEFNYDDPENMTLTFSNRFRMSSNKWIFSDMNNDTSSAVSSVNSLLSSAATPVTNGTIDRVTSYMDNALIAANQAIQDTQDNEFTFGGFGIRGRKLSTESPNYNGYSGEQIWISNNMISFTTDGWQTTKAVLGKISNGTYGLVQDNLVGNKIGN